MNKRIAVSDMLQPVKKILNQEGFDVINLEHDTDISPHEMNDYRAVIVSGMDDDLMGIQNISTNAVVINATGKSPQQVLEEIRRRLG